jgi:hypothetical protein
MQTKVKRVSFESMMQNRMFRVGYHETLEHTPFSRDYDKMSASDQIEYEYGRLFGVHMRSIDNDMSLIQHTPGKGRKPLNPRAVRHFKVFIYDGGA